MHTLFDAECVHSREERYIPMRTVESSFVSFGAPGARRCHGFTLIELMTTVVVLAVSLALAAPALSSFVRSNRVRAAQSELVSSLMLARSEAARRGGRAGAEALQPVADGGFNHGWRVWVDANTNGAYDAGDEVLREVQYSNESIDIRAEVGGVSVRGVVFNANGFLDPIAPVSFDVQASGVPTHYCIQLETVGLTIVAEKPCA